MFFIIGIFCLIKNVCLMQHCVQRSVIFFETGDFQREATGTSWRDHFPHFLRFDQFVSQSVRHSATSYGEAGVESVVELVGQVLGQLVQ